MIKNTAHNRKPLLPSVPDQTSSRSSTNTSITGGEDVANNFDDEWTTGNWCYVLPATPCSSGVAAAATAAAAAATTLIHGTSLSTEDNDDDDDTKIRHPPVDEISSGNTTEATNDDAADDDSAAAWEAGNWCWQQREEEKEEYCVRSGDRSCTKRKRNKQEQNNISTCDSMKVETNDDDGVGDEDTMHGDGRVANTSTVESTVLFLSTVDQHREGNRNRTTITTTTNRNGTVVRNNNSNNNNNNFQNERGSSAILVNEYDVLFGRGKHTREHTGNVRCAHLVEIRAEEYNACRKAAKTKIAEQVVTMVSDSGGRFLRKDTEVKLCESKSIGSYDTRSLYS